MMPKDGGNMFSGTGELAFSGPDLESSNWRRRAGRARPDKARRRPASLKKYRDAAAGVGGPIQRDKLWFFGAFRKGVTQQYATGIYYNKLKQPEELRWYRDRPSSPTRRHSNDFYRDYSLRLTWQAAEKHKFVVSRLVPAQLQLRVRAVPAAGRTTRHARSVHRARIRARLQLVRHLDVSGRPTACSSRSAGGDESHHPDELSRL